MDGDRVIAVLGLFVDKTMKVKIVKRFEQVESLCHNSTSFLIKIINGICNEENYTRISSWIWTYL